MVVSLEYEMVTFVASVLLAFFTGIVYDFFRAIRFFCKRIVIWDILMWLVILTAVFFVWFFVADGRVRWYMIIGTFFSEIIYFFTLSKYVFFVLKFALGKICGFFRIILKILLTPLCFLCKIVGVYVNKAKSKFSKKVEEKYDEKKAYSQDEYCNDFLIDNNPCFGGDDCKGCNVSTNN